MQFERFARRKCWCGLVAITPDFLGKMLIPACASQFI
jgi:hypothetical protein